VGRTFTHWQQLGGCKPPKKSGVKPPHSKAGDAPAREKDGGCKPPKKSGVKPPHSKAGDAPAKEKDGG